MATINGNKIDKWWYTRVVYTTTTSATAVTISATLYHYCVTGYSHTFSGDTWYLSCNGTTQNYSPTGTNVKRSAGTTKSIGSKTFTVARGTAAKTVTLKGYGHHSSSSSTAGTSTASVSITIPALASYTVAYKGNGNTGGSTASQTKYYGVNLTLRSNGFTRTGYTFQKWNTNASGTGTNYNAGATYSGNAALTLYAVWKANTYTISYNANGGSGSIASQTKTYGQTLTLSDGTGLSRTNYTLLGWSTSASATTATYAKGETVAATSLNANTTLYAVWKYEYVKPLLSVTAYRVANASSTVETDDGGYIYVNIGFTEGTLFSSYIASTITVTIDGTTVDTFSEAAGTGSGTETGTYGGTYSADTAHTVVVTIADSVGSISHTEYIQIAIYPIDIYGLGTDVYMGVMHKYESGQPLTVPDLYVDGNIYLSIDNNAGSGMDYDIRTALASLGWSDVLE